MHLGRVEGTCIIGSPTGLLDVAYSVVPGVLSGPGTQPPSFSGLVRTHNVVERTFGVWKIKWRILLKMPSYQMDKQLMIVVATICLHNYIYEKYALEKDSCKCDHNPDYVTTMHTFEIFKIYLFLGKMCHMQQQLHQTTGTWINVMALQGQSSFLDYHT